MIEGLREMLGLAAVALVQADNIEPREPCLFGGAEYVSRFTGSLETVQQHQRWVVPRIRLPMAFTAHLRSRLNVKMAGHAGRQSRKLSAPKAGGNRHQMTVPKGAEWFERFHHIPC